MKRDWIVTFQIPEAPNDFASVVAHSKATIPEVEAWVKSMFGTDIVIFGVIPRYPLSLDKHNDIE